MPSIDGVRIGHWTDTEAETGCTFVGLPPGTVASYEARGGAPASREIELLHPDKSVQDIDGVLLTGGSAFGLAAADGVLRHLEELGRGVPTAAGRVPIVPTLALFDLAVGRADIRPTPESGRAAAEAAQEGRPFVGRIGAGAGAYVGHWRGPEGRRPAGLGSAEKRFGELVVWALCAVNAFGDIDHGGSDVAIDAVEHLAGSFAFDGDRRHTTIGVIVTNARLTKTECHVVAQGGHDGLARALTPPHTRFDGDGLIAAATGRVEAHVDLVRLLALSAVAAAIRATADTDPGPRTGDDDARPGA